MANANLKKALAAGAAKRQKRERQQSIQETERLSAKEQECQEKLARARQWIKTNSQIYNKIEEAEAAFVPSYSHTAAKFTVPSVYYDADQFPKGIDIYTMADAFRELEGLYAEPKHYHDNDGPDIDSVTVTWNRK